MSAGYLRENQTLASNAAQVAYGAVGHGRDAADARARRLAGLLVAGKQSPRARASAGLLPVTQQTRGLVGWLVWHLAWLEPPTTTTRPRHLRTRACAQMLARARPLARRNTRTRTVACTHWPAHTGCLPVCASTCSVCRCLHTLVACTHGPAPPPRPRLRPGFGPAASASLWCGRLPGAPLAAGGSGPGRA